MKSSIELFENLVIIWAAILLIFNFPAQAFNGISCDENSSAASKIDSLKILMNGPIADDILERQGRVQALDGIKPDRPMINPVFMGKGLATKSNVSHSFFVIILKVRHIDPSKMRELMTADPDIEKLRARIYEKSAEATLAGDIRLGDHRYYLEHIDIKQLQDGIALEADLMESPSFQESESTQPIVGHLMLTAPNPNSLESVKGELNMNEKGFFGKYLINLKELAPNVAETHIASHQRLPEGLGLMAPLGLDQV